MANFEEDYKTIERDIINLEDQLYSSVSIDLQDKLLSSIQEEAENLNKLCLFAEIQHVKNQICVHECLTDVRIKQVDKSKQSSVHVQQVKGEISDIEFAVKFTTENQQDPSEKNSPKVTKMSISVNTGLPDHIQKFLTRCEVSCSIEDFIQGFVSYVNWCKLRKKTYEYFKKKYNKLVLLDGNDSLLHAKAKEEEYTISWENIITNKLLCQPVLDLYITTPMQGNTDSHSILSSQFQVLVRKHGIETAIDTLLSGLS